MTVLSLSPHTDDSEFGAGGTLAHFVEQGHHVCVFVFSYCEESVPEGFDRDVLHHEQHEASKHLGVHLIDNATPIPVRHFPEHRQWILDRLIYIRHYLNPDLVLCPASSDVHQDHGTVRDEAFRAFKHTSSIWGYELPWNVHPLRPFSPHIYHHITSDNFERKWNALEAYKSQASRSYMNVNHLLSQARMRGAERGVPLAEAFEAIRIMS